MLLLLILQEIPSGQTFRNLDFSAFDLIECFPFTNVHSEYATTGDVVAYLKHIEITNKVQPCTRIYYSSVLLIAYYVSSDTPLIIRSSKTVIAASGFTYVCGCRPLSVNSVPTQP